MSQQPNRYLALLRGINVGGKNIISKDALKACFEDLELGDVRTYIQSGNVLFRSGKTAVKTLTEEIETGLSERFAYNAQAVILPHRKFKSALAAAPSDWGRDDERKHNALFTLAGTTPKKVLARLPDPKPGIESVSVGPGVLFWSVDKDSIAKTTMLKVAQNSVYQQLTVRNHNTVFKLAELLEAL